MKINELLGLRVKLNETFKLPTNEEPTILSKDRHELQYELMFSELDEYKQACENKEGLIYKDQMTSIADALIDMQEVLLGMFAEHGLIHLFKHLYLEVNKSNMSKLDKNGEPIINGDKGYIDISKPIGKIIKSELFKEPDFKSIIFKNK